MGGNSFIQSINSHKGKGVKMIGLLFLFLFSMITYGNSQSAILAYDPIKTSLPEFHFVKLKYIKTHDVLPLLRGICNDCNWVLSHSRQTVGLTAKQDDWKRFRKTIRQLDKPAPQVGLKIDIIEVGNLNSERYQQLFANLTEPIMLGQNIESSLQLMISSGNAKIVSSPKLVGVSGYPLLLNVGEKIPYISSVETNGYRSTQLNYIDTGVSLEITPFIHYRNDVDLSVKLNYSTINGYRTEMGIDLPILASRHSQVDIQVAEGKTVVFAGLLDKSQHISIEKLPILGNLPLIGFLFQRKITQIKQTDLILKVTPVVIEQ